MADMSTDPLFVKQNGQHFFYHTDHLGTPQKLTAVNGAVVWSAMYSSFGEAQVLPSSTVENNFRFAGQYYDQETGLHYNWHRYYDPELGRYLRVDPILSPTLWNHENTNDTNKFLFILPSLILFPEMISSYGYSNNNPIIYVDAVGYGLLDFMKCLYYGRKITELQKICKDEMAEDCKKFCEKYGCGGWPSQGIWNCVRAKDPGLWKRWTLSCFEGGWGPGGPAKPKPTPK